MHLLTQGHRSCFQKERWASVLGIGKGPGWMCSDTHEAQPCSLHTELLSGYHRRAGPSYSSKRSRCRPSKTSKLQSFQGCRRIGARQLSQVQLLHVKASQVTGQGLGQGRHQLP